MSVASWRKTHDGPRNIVRKVKTRNSGHWLAAVDGRSHFAKHARAVCRSLIADKGGNLNVSEAETQLLRRAGVLVAELDRMEEMFATADKAEPSAFDAYQRGCNTLRRLLEAVGLERRSRDVTPSLSEYLQRQPATIDGEIVE
jgi:hypothetical protein